MDWLWTGKLHNFTKVHSDVILKAATFLTMAVRGIATYIKTIDKMFSHSQNLFLGHNHLTELTAFYSPLHYSSSQ